MPAGRVLGIPLRLDWSLLVVAWLLTWALATGALPELAPGYSRPEYWSTGALTSALFLGSLLAHELSHAVVARRLGIGVRDITLWLLGGIAALEDEPRTPRRELAVALAGPAASASIAVAALGGAAAAAVAGAPELAVTAATWLGSMNAVLAVFNLVPAAPLDGGRVLRAVLWHRTGDRARAARAAARAGRAFGWILVGVGVVELTAGAASGVWLALVGWFVLGAAGQEETQLRVAEDLDGVRVRDVMTPDPVTASPDLTVGEVLDDLVMRLRCSTFPLVDRDGRLRGLVTLQRIERVPPGERARTRVGDVAAPPEHVTTARPDEALLEVLRRARTGGEGRVLVVDGERLVGIVSPTDVSQAIRRAELGRAA